MTENKEVTLNVGDFNDSYYVSESEIKSNRKRIAGESADIKSMVNKASAKSKSLSEKKSIKMGTNSMADSTTSLAMATKSFTDSSSGTIGLATTTDSADFNFNSNGTNYFFNSGGYVDKTNSAEDWKEYINLKIPTNTIIFMEEIVQFTTFTGYEKKDLNVQVVKGQVQVKGKRSPIKGYDSNYQDSVEQQWGFEFDEETYDAKNIKVSFLNGLLRVEVPLREDIVSDISID